jgi:hypothetical protein
MYVAFNGIVQSLEARDNSRVDEYREQPATTRDKHDSDRGRSAEDG